MLFGARGVGGRAERQREAEMGSRVGSVKLWREGAVSPGAEADGLGWCGEERS